MNSNQMANLLLEVMRDRMMVDRGLVENVYLPWLMSVMNGDMKPGALLNHKTIDARQSDLKNHEYRELVDNDNAEPLINNILIPSATRFINTVKQNRKGKISEDSDVYRGKLYEGEDIVKEGLADGFGTLYDALEVASGMAMMRGR